MRRFLKALGLLLLATVLGGCATLGWPEPGSPTPDDSRPVAGKGAGGKAAPRREAVPRTPSQPVTTAAAETQPPEAPPATSFAEAALHFLKLGRLQTAAGTRSMHCSELVQAIYDVLPPVPVRLTGATADLHYQCRERGWLVKSPAPGDLVFFDNTLDRNRNRRLDDPLTHVGVVVQVEPDGLVHFVHVGSRRLKEGLLHAGQPGAEQSPEGRPLNSHLRTRSSRDPGGTRYLAGQLLRGYCRPSDGEGR